MARAVSNSLKIRHFYTYIAYAIPAAPLERLLCQSLALGGRNRHRTRPHQPLSHHTCYTKPVLAPPTSVSLHTDPYTGARGMITAATRHSRRPSCSCDARPRRHARKRCCAAAPAAAAAARRSCHHRVGARCQHKMGAAWRVGEVRIRAPHLASSSFRPAQVARTPHRGEAGEGYRRREVLRRHVAIRFHILHGAARGPHPLRPRP